MFTCTLLDTSVHAVQYICTLITTCLCRCSAAELETHPLSYLAMIFSCHVRLQMGSLNDKSLLNFNLSHLNPFSKYDSGYGF
jgi:hypothetical protein